MQISVGQLPNGSGSAAGGAPWIPAALANRRAIARAGLLGLLACGDALAIAVAFALAYILRFKTQIGLLYLPVDSPLRFYSTLVFWLVPLVVLTFAVYRLYALDRLFDGFDEYVRILSATTLSMIGVVLVSFFLDTRLVISRAWMIISWVLILLAVATVRFLIRRLVYRLRRAGHLCKRVIVIGGGQEANDLAAHLQMTKLSGLQVAEVIDPEDLRVDEVDTEQGQGTRLRQFIVAAGADAVVVSAASVPQETLSKIVRDLAGLPTELHLVPGMYEILTTGVQVREIRGLPLVTMNKVRIVGYDRLLKQLLDYVAATLLLLILAPLFIGIALLIRFTSPGPVFHRRRVVGQCGGTFAAYKFRTMYVNGDAILDQHPELKAELAEHGKLIEDPRITWIGRWLRRWSLDELPQLLNVLRGQMSLVGPRMISEAELDRFGHWRENLSTVKPGLTGLWQISGRSTLGYDERVRLDMHYIRSYSIWSDIEILARTLPAVISGRGAY